MDKFALIGWPAAGSLSPLLFGAAYGGKYGYGFIEQQDWATAWRIFTEGDYRAVNVTAPHKMEAARAAAWRSPEVEAIGAANILVKTDDGIKAYNSDYLAVKQLIRIHAPEARTAVVRRRGQGCLQGCSRLRAQHNGEAALRAHWRSVRRPCNIYPAQSSSGYGEHTLQYADRGELPGPPMRGPRRGRSLCRRKGVAPRPSRSGIRNYDR